MIAAVALWWRRRWPVGITLGLIPIALFSVSAAVSLLILLFTVAVHRRFVVAAAVGAVSLAGNAVFALIRPDTSMPYWMAMVWSAVFIVVVMLWGMVIRARRQLVWSLRDRARRAESEQQLRVAQARVLERTRIAREMHDVLAHRLSLLSLHAGALEIRPDASPTEVARAAGVIRGSARQALQDLREVIGVLREVSLDAEPERPQPTLEELQALAEESREAGQRVRLELRVDAPETVPEGTGRTAYRIVQEGLTNARRHAPGTAVVVRVGGCAADGLSIEIRNPWPLGRDPAHDIAGTGTGLIGLAERASLAGGRLAHGRSAGEFALTAWLPWPT
jgi:signal transduction histidine kinase